MIRRLFCLILIGCLCLSAAVPVGAQPRSAAPVPLLFTAHGITLPTANDPDAPAAVLTDHDAWLRFATSFPDVDAACFSVRGSFDDRALLAVPLAEDGYVTAVEADDTTVYVTCSTLGTLTASQRYLLIETDPTAVRGKTLCVNTAPLRAAAFATDTAVVCRGNPDYVEEQLFTSREELSALAEACYGCDTEAVSALDAFDAAFFENNVLLYTALMTPSSGYNLSVAPYALCTDSTVLVRRVKTVPSYNDYTLSVVGCYAYLIPMPRSLYQGQAVAVMDEIGTAGSYYPRGASLTFDVLYQGLASGTQAVDSCGTLIRTYDEWCAAVAADSQFGTRYAAAADASYFDDHAVVVLHGIAYFTAERRRVYDVVCDNARLSVVTEWASPDTFYPNTLRECFVVGVPKDAVTEVIAVDKHDMHFAAVHADSFTYEPLPDGTARVIGCALDDAVLVIPSHLDGREVSAIGEGCFLRNVTVETVVLPDTLKVIEAGAFQASRVRQVFLPEGLLTVEQQAFFACSELDTLVIPSTVTTLGEHAVGFGYYVDPAEPVPIPGAVGVRDSFTLIADHNAAAVAHATENGIACRRVEDCSLGDTDFDGSVSAADGRLLLRYILHGYTRTWSVSDLNDNGLADTTDVRLLLRGLVNT